MGPLTLLFYLVLGHFVADIVLQPDFVAQHKRPDNSLPAIPWYYVLTSHAATHGLMVALLSGSIGLGLLETTAHWGIDYMKCQNRFNIHVDQSLHLICKLLWVIFLWFANS